MRKRKKSMKDHVDNVVDQLPDRAELLDLKDQLADKLPDKSEWLQLRDDLLEKFPDKDELIDMRDGLVDKLPNEVSDRLPVETKKKKRFAGVKKFAFVGLLTAGIAGVAAFVRAKMDDEPTYTATTYTTPGAPAGTAPGQPVDVTTRYEPTSTPPPPPA